VPDAGCDCLRTTILKRPSSNKQLPKATSKLYFPVRWSVRPPKKISSVICPFLHAGGVLS